MVISKVSRDSLDAKLHLKLMTVDTVLAFDTTAREQVGGAKGVGIGRRAVVPAKVLVLILYPFSYCTHTHAVPILVLTLILYSHGGAG
jgi:hypothetical protein